MSDNDLTTVTIPESLSDVLASLSGGRERTQIELIEGEPWPFLLTTYAAEMIERQTGVDPVASLSRLMEDFFGSLMALDGGLEMIREALSGDAAQQVSDSEKMSLILQLAKGVMQNLSTRALSDYAAVIFWGCAPFNPDLSLEEVKLRTTPESIVRTVQNIFERGTSYAKGSPDLTPATWEGADDEEEEGEEEQEKKD